MAEFAAITWPCLVLVLLALWVQVCIFGTDDTLTIHETLHENFYLPGTENPTLKGLLLLLTATSIVAYMAL